MSSKNPSKKLQDDLVLIEADITEAWGLDEYVFPNKY